MVAQSSTQLWSILSEYSRNPTSQWSCPDSQTIILWFYYQMPLHAGSGRGLWCKNGSSNLWWHVAVHLLRFLHLLRGMTLRGWIFIFLLHSRGRPALGRTHVHGRKMPRCAGTVGGIIKISLKVSAHSWGGHIAFDSILLVLWSITRNKAWSRKWEDKNYLSLNC